jgi:hypothetical protein
MWNVVIVDVRHEQQILSCGRWGFFSGRDRLNTMIGLTGYRTRDLLHVGRALYRRTEKALLTYVATYHICTKLRHYHGPPGLSSDRSPAPKPV